MIKREKWILSLVFLVLILALTGTIATAAMSSGSFLIKSNSLAGACVPSGQTSSSSYAMTGAWGGMIGSSSSASYQLDQGCLIGHFIIPTPTDDYTTFLPLILR